MSNLAFSWHLECFGPLRARSSERVVERFRTQKTAVLLALLALKGAQPREALCDLLWPDAAPEAARNSLSAALSALRREFGDEALSADRFQIALTPRTFSTDVALFDAALASGDLATATALYRSHFLPGFYEEPLLAMAREYEEKARLAFDNHLQNLEARGEHTEVIGTARRALALFPGTMSWFVAMMRAHHALRQHDAALEVFKELGNAARRDSELVPDAARHLARQIRREREATTGAAPAPAILETLTHATRDNEPLDDDADAAHQAANLLEPASHLEDGSGSLASTIPQTWTHFFGRESDINELADLLERGERFLTLTGMGGTGKTRLLIEVGRRAAPRWSDRVYFVPLATLSDQELFFSTIRDALGIVLAPDSPPLQQIVGALGTEPVLLLLDNFEQLVAGGAEKLQQLRIALPNATFVVSSRIVLNLPGEREWPVAPLPTPRENASLDECPSSALFLDRARAARPSFALSPENERDIAALCRRLDGIPLAIELAAARVRVLSPGQILERVEKQLDFLQTREHGVPERQRTLRATIEWSYDQLPPEEQAFFARLSVFRGGWTLEAAEEICALDPEDAFEVLDYLERLREYSMISTHDTPQGTRFRTLEVLREWGASKLAQDELFRDELRERHFCYYLGLIRSANDVVSLMERSEELRAESANFRAALAWTMEREDDGAANDAAQLAGALCPWWEHRNLFSEGREWVLRVLRKSGDVEPRWRARLLRGAGSLSLCCGETVPAQSMLEEALAITHKLQDSPGEAYILHRLAVAMMLRGQIETATNYAEKSLALARELQDPALLIGALTSLGWAHHNNNRHTDAQRAMMELRELARQMGNVELEALTYSFLGYSFLLDNRPQEALAHSEHAMHMLGQLPETGGWHKAFVQAIQGVVTRETGDLETAAQLTKQAIATFNHIATRWEVASALNDCGMLAVDTGRWQLAAQFFGAADRLSEHINYRLLLSIESLRIPRYEKLRHELGVENLRRYTLEGAQLSLDEAVALAQSL